MAETATGAGPMKELMSRKPPKALKSLSCSEHREEEQTSVFKALDLRLELPEGK